MHAPRPYGLFGPELDSADAAAADALARKLTNLKEASGLTSLKLTRTLPSGAVAVATDMGGVFRVKVYPPGQPPEASPFQQPPSAYVPMLFSGRVTRPVVREGQGVEIEITDATRRRLAGYDPGRLGQIAAHQALQRFAIPYASRFAELRPKDVGESALIYTQYAKLRPSWYSGRAATLAQVALGYGRQDFKALPRSPVERAVLALPERVRRAAQAAVGRARLPGYTGLPPETGQLEIDYKFAQCHAVSFDDAGKPWLARIDREGVMLMPLPVVPATTTPAFRQWIQDKGDDELLWLLDTFGAMPTGEGFPQDVQAWRRAGVITQVNDTREFFSHLSYSVACGWSFNTSGSQGVNTCYDYSAVDGGQVGLTYMLTLTPGVAQDEGRLSSMSGKVDPKDAPRLNAYLAALVKQLGNPHDDRGVDRDRAILYKLWRVPVAEIVARAQRIYLGAVDQDVVSAQMATEVQYWDDRELEPIAAHMGRLRTIDSGPLFAVKPGTGKAGPQIKFPDPAREACLSHDFAPREGASVPPERRIDTTMYAWHVGDDLKLVKCFHDPRGYWMGAEGDTDIECMTVGSWQWTTYSGLGTIQGEFYTTDFDDRKAAAPELTTTKVVGEDKGYDALPCFSQEYIFARNGTIWRNRYFTHKTVTDSTQGYSLGNAACVPYYTRDAVLYAMRESNTGTTHTEGLALYAVQDPNSYIYFTQHFVWAWRGGPGLGNMANAHGVSPYPHNGNPVWVVGYNYYPSHCSDFADQGDWMGGLPQDYTWLIHPDANVWQGAGGGGAPQVKTYSNRTAKPGETTGALSISLPPQPAKVNDKPGDGYFAASPDRYSNTFYVDAIRNAAGEAAYANCAEPDPNDPKRRKRWGYTRLATHDGAHQFIGVLNA